MKSAVINTALVLTSIVLALFVSELVLAALDFEPAYNIKTPNTTKNRQRPSPTIPRRECFASSLEDMIEEGIITSNLGYLTPDKELGYVHTRGAHGLLDHKRSYNAHENYKRVLVLGDSFTAGYSADPGKDYVTLLQKYYEDKGVIFYNTGTAGYAQNNQLAVLKKYTDLITPNLVLLGFYPHNDFTDNLTPLDRFTVFSGKWIQNYEVIILDNRVHVRRRSPDELLRIYQSAIGCGKRTATRVRSLKDLLREELFYRTRIGTSIYYLFYKWKHLLDPVERKYGRQIKDRELTVTEDYLLQMKRYLELRNTPFYILLIPDPVESKDRLKKSKYYYKAIHLLEKHSIPYLDPFENLSLEDYDWDSGNDHWNNSGHFKVYELIRGYFGDDLEVHLRNSDEYH